MAGKRKAAQTNCLYLTAPENRLILLNFEFFIAHRITKSKTAAKRITRPVIRISIWAIAIGIIIMIIAMATGNGLRKEIRNKVIGFSGDIQILNYQPNATYEQIPASISDSVQRLILSRDEVVSIQPVGQKAGILKTDDLFEGAILKGIDSNYDWSNLHPYISEGSGIKINDTAYNDSILISKTLAQRLKIGVHERISMYFVRQAPKPPLLRKFYISGIFHTDFEAIDNNFIIGDLKHIQRLNGWDSNQVGGYEIFLEEEGFQEYMQQVLRSFLPSSKRTFDQDQIEQAKKIRVLLPYELDALPARKLNEQMFQWLDLFDNNTLVVIFIMIIVATINMSIALLILILERTQMVGILKALGSHNGSIRKIFLINAGYLIFKGLFWGNVIGIGLCLLQKQFGLIKLDPTTYYVSQVSIDLNLGSLLMLNLLTVVICLICMVLPSYLITRISPIKAIRFD